MYNRLYIFIHKINIILINKFFFHLIFYIFQIELQFYHRRNLIYIPQIFIGTTRSPYYLHRLSLICFAPDRIRNKRYFIDYLYIHMSESSIIEVFYHSVKTAELQIISFVIAAPCFEFYLPSGNKFL